jgi:death on curing protein
MTTKYLSKKNIIAIHEELIERFGGLHGIRDEALLESAIGRYQSGYYADNIEETAALMESLGGNHPFIDGNKRIAVTAPFVFLRANGYVVTLDNKSAFEFISNLFLRQEFSFSRLEPWIRESIKPQETDNLKSRAPDRSAYPEIEALAKNIENLSIITRGINFLLEQRTSDLSILESIQKSSNPALVVEFCIKWIKITTADINAYLDQSVQQGDEFLKSWANIAQWTENQIPHIQNQNTLKQLSNLFQIIMKKISDIRGAMRQGTRTIVSTTSVFGDLRQQVSARSTTHQTTSEQILTTLDGYETSINRYTGFQQGRDEQLSIAVDSCDRLIKLISVELDS